MYHSTMLKTIVPATLEFKAGVPYSTQYGDLYHSADDGAGQARHVFLQGCGLPQAWANQPSFVILETGFGTGLNFLTTWAAWQADSARPSRLHFLSVEKHPFQLDDLARLHAQWQEFSELSGELLANWPMLTPGFHRIALDGGRVQLTLMRGEAIHIERIHRSLHLRQAIKCVAQHQGQLHPAAVERDAMKARCQHRPVRQQFTGEIRKFRPLRMQAHQIGCLKRMLFNRQEMEP